MTLLQALLLGIVQGLTEYVPVSSSAHLVLVPNILGWQFCEKESFIFDVLVQLGTLFGVMIFFAPVIRRVVVGVIAGLVAKDPWSNSDSRMGWLVVIATMPAALIGILFKDSISGYFSSPLAACYCLIFTGFAMMLAEKFAKKFERNMNQIDALSIGFAQTLALLPGVSRSGSTIAAGIARGFSRTDAARFSFLMSIPVMLGASLVASIELFKDAELVARMAMPLLVGFISAAISGYIVIKWFMKFLGTHRLIWFSFYCISIGLLGIKFFGA
ncbi:MAG: undecaprenyl-diphosphatase UppP [Myxococcales bacterium]|nr:undecaprenyl-diphosphatase UppP [Myxococcales bacterium]USN49943.1 MAG: undecaprenyl-diphosphatase UppP [Myxococcales bacterium]